MAVCVIIPSPTYIRPTFMGSRLGFPSRLEMDLWSRELHRSQQKSGWEIKPNWVRKSTKIPCSSTVVPLSSTEYAVSRPSRTTTPLQLVIAPASAIIFSRRAFLGEEGFSRHSSPARTPSTCPRAATKLGPTTSGGGEDGPFDNLRPRFGDLRRRLGDPFLPVPWFVSMLWPALPARRLSPFSSPRLCFASRLNSFPFFPDSPVLLPSVDDFPPASISPVGLPAVCACVCPLLTSCSPPSASAFPTSGASKTIWSVPYSINELPRVARHIGTNNVPDRPPPPDRGSSSISTPSASLLCVRSSSTATSSTRCFEISASCSWVDRNHNFTVP
mmetsp:Transcript_9648/g.27059  ORF Transcript_9648/g.27059 Transcript_9648/m.27059 type:complete len:330 (-) Transcript_9648:724-1713(-)